MCYTLLFNILTIPLSIDIATKLILNLSRIINCHILLNLVGILASYLFVMSDIYALIDNAFFIQHFNCSIYLHLITVKRFTNMIQHFVQNFLVVLG